ncbi:DEAD-domain-containing protein [Teratosphaeria nubilosa]|uniref:ATP-dependent RNA helicase n=1 Tax=Teratosphaeria nubilosa TaxID=161662 RepID=A0A6G1L3S7_9PEZI|nr:DEAD-domain-containing protein [Teratosphaeria nubilosa]
MAEDGILLNFELPTNELTAAPRKIKGGNWKDRLTAKKSQAYGRQKAQERASGGGLSRTPNYGDYTKPARPTNRPSGSKQPHRGDVLPKLNDGQVVSSLFTYNQTSQAPQEAKAEAQEEEMTVEPSNAPLTDELATFTSMGLSSTLASHLLRKMDIKAPTAIQRKSIEQLCTAHTDAFIQAQTGSGKTLAYLLPIVQRISELSRQMKEAGENFTRDRGLFAIILAPTRELAKQISTVLESLLSCCHWIVQGIVIGGESKKSEKARLRKGVNILVATPGRLTDHINNTGVLDVSKVRWLVLDEGDRLMELGFEQDIQKIVSVLNLRSRKAQETPIPGLPERRTTVLCSATIKANVDQLRSIALKDPVSIAVDASEAPLEGETAKEQAFSAPAQLKQSYVVAPPKQRLVTLVAALKQAFKRKGSVMKCIVFMSCADSVDYHFELMTRRDDGKTKDNESDEVKFNGKLSKTNHIHQGNTISESRTEGLATAFSGQDNSVHLYRLHGSLQQATRTSTLKAFSKTSEPAVLVCTDVASRGLDLPNVDLVIEYDPPFSKDDHLHRAGRTARAGKDGRAMIFLMPGCEEGYVSILKDCNPRNLTSHTAEDLLKKGFAPTSGVVNDKSWEDLATEYQLDVERWTSEHPKHLEQARRAYQSHIRAYATHVAAERSIFNIKELHLGHLAKAFGLRDKPGAIRVPGLRPGKESAGKTKHERKAQAGKKADAATVSGGKRSNKFDEEDFETSVADAEAARRKMQALSKKMGGVGEFNLG